MGRKKLERYAAKLLFQFRVVSNGDSNKMRTSEERIINLRAKSASKALEKVKERGIKSEFDYINSDGNEVYFEFVGVMDFVHLGIECRDDEVWYNIKDYLLPMERKDKLIPDESQLLARIMI